MNELDFAFIDAAIAGDIDEALRIAYEIMQGEQLQMDI